MTSRERILRVLNHRIPDRVPIHDSVWTSTERRWHKEGLPEDMSPAEYFGYELDIFGPDLTPRFPVRVMEKNEEFIITTTSCGGRIKNHRDYSTTPEIIDWPVKTKDDWKEVKKRMAPDMTRVNWASGLQGNLTAHEEGKFMCFGCATGYDALQNYMKSEQILVTMAEDPDWIKDMIMTIAELSIVMAELMLKNGFKLDGLFTYNDMGYRNGLLFSPEIYMKTHSQADRLLYEYFHSKGMKVILHSCGNVTEIIPALIEAGLDCLQPIEVKSGMDIISIKEKFGDRLSFMGGIDVRLMADSDPDKIEAEIKNKLEAAKKGGGYIYHSDHSVPKNVSFEQYRRVIELVKKYGAYPEYEEAKKEEGKEKEAPPKEEKAASGKTSKLKFGKKKKEGAKSRPVERPAAAPAEGKKEKSGLFGRKKKEAAAAPQAPAIPTKQEIKQEDKGGKKLKLPFGRKK